jgi:hypothetical protein
MFVQIFANQLSDLTLLELLSDIFFKVFELFCLVHLYFLFFDAIVNAILNFEMSLAKREASYFHFAWARTSSTSLNKCGTCKHF